MKCTGSFNSGRQSGLMLIKDVCYECRHLLGGLVASEILRPLKTFAHELGHKFTAELLYSGANARIVLDNFGFSGATCHWDAKALSSAGQFFGRQGSHALVSAGGPMVDFVINAIAYSSGSKTAAIAMLPGSILVSIYALSYFLTSTLQTRK